MTLEDCLLPKIEVEPDDEECSVAYFRALLASESKRLSNLCDSWEKKLVLYKGVISDVTEGELRSVIGQGRLVMAERFNQFSGLVDNCEFKQGEKETTCMDLKGFWEMIYFQVEDVDKKFTKLKEVENNNWVYDDEDKNIIKGKTLKTKNSVGNNKKKATLVAKKVASAGLKALIAARRKASFRDKYGEIEDDENIQETETANSIIDKASDQKSPLLSPEKTFDGGFFSVKSPIRQLNTSPRTSRSAGCDKLRKSVVTESAKRVSGLISPYVSQIAKRAVNTERLSPVRRSSLFDEDFDEEEDDDMNKDEKGNNYKPKINDDEDVFQVAALRL